jgi:predicted nucleotidyltransferase
MELLLKKNSIEDKKLKKIVKIIVDEISPKKIILFGSRGKGTSSFNSDYDIAIDSKLIGVSEKRKLKEKIDKVIGLHKIDLIFLKEIDPGFKNIILKTGKTIYGE